MGYNIINGCVEYLETLMQKCVSANKVESCSCVKEIWLMRISILKGQYAAFIGKGDTIFLKQQSFKGKWKDLFVFVERNDKMVWQYVPPRWLFPP